MKHEDGAACPMHRAKPKEAPCSLRAACQSDIFGLSAVFVYNGLPLDTFVFLEDDFSSASLVSTPSAAPLISVTADTPPPRA